ncbi:MFS transporter [Candidatus Bathyarchaeota archaeon]|nr:MFS transporter [Candidatus Bathyarchaeota archaeon]MBS7629531.1 MFS transporter [Candidatus Bathyarchaeota archaeon]
MRVDSVPTVEIKKPSFTLGVCSVAHFVNDGLDMALPVILPLLVSRYNLTLFEAGMILTCYSATSVFSQPLIGYLSDLTGYKKIYLASGLILMGLSLFSIQFANSLILIFPLTFLAGLGFSIYHPISMSVINTVYVERRGFGLGIHGLGGSLGRGVYPAILGVLLATYGLSGSLLLTSATGLLAGVLALNLPCWGGAGVSRGSIVTSINLIILVGSIFLFRTVFYSGIISFTPTFLVRDLKLDLASAGISTSLILIFGVVSQPVGGYFSDKFGRRNVLALSCLFMGLFLIIFLATPYPISLVALSISGFWMFLGFPLPYAVIGDHVPEESLSTSLGLISGFSGVGSMIGPMLVGRLGDLFGLGNGMLAASSFALVSAALSILLPRPSRR